MASVNIDSDKLDIDMHFSFFSQSVSRIEYGLQQQAEEAVAKLSEPRDELDPQVQYLIEMQLQNELELAAGFVPPLVFSTMLAAVWSSFEHALTIVTQQHLCATLPSSLDAGERTKRLNKIRDLTEIKKHWENKHGEKVRVRFPSGWDEILDIREVRNLIVHDNSWRHEMATNETDSEELVRHKRVKTILTYIARREQEGRRGLSFDGDQLIVTSDYCHEVVKTLCAYLKTLVDALEPVESEISQHVIDVLYPKRKGPRVSGRKADEAVA